MSIDAAFRAEVVLGGHSVKPIGSEEILAFDDAQPLHRNSTHNRSFPAAHGAGAATRVDDALWQVEFQDNTPTMTARPMSGLYQGASDLTNRVESHLCRLTVPFSGRTMSP